MNAAVLAALTRPKPEEHEEKKEDLSRVERQPDANVALPQPPTE